jgi:ubiquinone/menaquinone biosynthesis C-methylase UbiE
MITAEMGGRIYEATWGRIFAAVYDRALAASEDAGLRMQRAEVLAEASGRVLEIGAGTGLNLEHYPAQVDELVLAEPDPHMARRLRRRAEDSARAASVVEAPGETLPFPDDSFDTVACTLVLCTVPEPSRTLAEVARALRPGGRFLFIEHVRADDPRLARWQDRLHGIWKAIGDGCNCNRETLSAIRQSPLELEGVRHTELPRALPIVRPEILGSAVLPG